MSANHMPRRRLRATFAALALLVAVLGACSASVSVGNVSGDAGMTQFAPKDQSAALKAVKLGATDSDKFDDTRTGTTFPAGTKKLAVWYRWDGAKTGTTRIDIRWSSAGQTVLQQNETLDATSGESAWLFSKASGEALAAGSYQVELLENGTVQSTIPFTVSG